MIHIVLYSNSKAEFINHTKVWFLKVN